MAASLSSVTMRGFGNGTFAGDINLVATLGYGISNVVIVTGPYYVAAAGWWIPGQVRGQAYVPGQAAGQAYVPGATKGQAT